MPFPPDRKSAIKRRLCHLFLAGSIAGSACSFPDYTHGEDLPETCSNGKVDGDETQVDCGGHCLACVTCQDDSVCNGLECIDGMCRAECEDQTCEPTCDDSILNGDESGADCGGSCPARCAVGQPCFDGSDCIDGSCSGNECQSPTCTDDVVNGGESDEDCGRVCETRCAFGQHCELDSDCQSDVCADGACAREYCANNEHDISEGETDVDCGGDTTSCQRCPVGDGCVVGSDCREKVCENEICLEPTCEDEQSNGEESGVDCGGASDCPRCATGATCQAGTDCADGVCLDTECQAATCEDQTLNGLETDEDCGGDDCDACDDDLLCQADSDCVSQKCDAVASSSESRCTPATCDDAIQNGTELGLDCGGDDCPLCALDDDCSNDAACASYLCAAGSCAVGLNLDYACGQCGNQGVNDMVSFTLIITNLTTNAADVSGLSFRYYLSAETTSGLGFTCAYNGGSCGPDPSLSSSGIDNSTATHYIETSLGSTLTAISAGESAEIFVEVSLNGSPMDQSNDYSFNKDAQLEYTRIPIYRDGLLIWGTEPTPTN